MKGIKPSDLRKVKRDAELVEKEARVVLTISGDKVIESFNPNGLLWVIAILGPSRLKGELFEKALLCEIGMWETRPYHRAGDIWINGKRIYLPERKKQFTLDEKQYLLVSPEVFSLFQKLTNERVKKRKRGPDNPFYIRLPNYFYFPNQRAFSIGTSYKPRRRGLRFSVAFKDQYFLQDLFWAEKNLSQQLKDQLRGMANIINKALSPYENSRRAFKKLKAVKEIRRMILRSRLQKYLLIEMLERYLPEGQKNPFWPYVVSDIVQWDGKEPEERKLASSVLPEPQKRTGSIELKVTTSFDGINIYGTRSWKVPKIRKECIVFEVFGTGDERYQQRVKTSRKKKLPPRNLPKQTK